MPKTLLKRTIILALALGLWGWGVPAYAEPSSPEAKPKTTVTNPANPQESPTESDGSTETADTALPTVDGKSTATTEKSEDTEIARKSEAPTLPGEAREATAPAELRQGHMDAFYVTSSADGQLQLRIKEDVTGSGVVRTPESATMMMGENWYVTGLDWRLPDCENAGYASSSQHPGQMLFPGWSSSDFSLDGFSQVKVHFTEVNAPQGARIALVTQTLNGKTLPVLRQGNFYIAPGTELGITPRGHQHFHWLFTKPGTYQFRAKVVGQREGKTVESPEVTYTWVAEGTPADLDPVGTDPQCHPWVPNPSDYPEDEDSAPLVIPQGDGKPVFSAGHLDVFYVSTRSNNVVLATKEDITGVGVIRTPESYYLRVRDNALASIPSGLQSQLGTQGYLLEENGSHQSSMLFPGWDTNTVAPKFQAVDMLFSEITGPGKVFLFHSGEGGKIKPALKDGSYAVSTDASISQPFPAHSHVNWLFEKPGVYTMKVQVYASSPQGDEGESNIATYTWIVGDKTPLPADAQTGNPGNPGNPGDSDDTGKPGESGADQGKPGLDLVGSTGKGGAGKGGTAAPGIQGKKTGKKAAPKAGKKSGKKPAPKPGKKAGKKPGVKAGKKSSKAAKPAKPAPKKKNATTPPAATKGKNSVSQGNPGDTNGFEAFAPTGFPEFDASNLFGSTDQAGIPPAWAAGSPPATLPGFTAVPPAAPSIGSGSANSPLPGQSAAPNPSPASPPASHEQLNATGQSPYGSAVVRERAGLDPVATFLVGTGIASGLLGLALLVSHLPGRIPVLRRATRGQ